MTENAKTIDDFLRNCEPKLTESATYLLKPFLSVVSLPKKHVLVKEKQICGKVYFICKGASRSFYLQNGVEVHTWFAFENEVIGSLRNFNNLPSRENIELLEESVLIAFDIAGIQTLMQENIEVANFVNVTILEYALFMEDKFFDLHMKPSNEKFSALLAHSPEIFQRVPLTYIASYLGISRETLSRLRAK